MIATHSGVRESARQTVQPTNRETGSLLLAPAAVRMPPLLFSRSRLPGPPQRMARRFGQRRSPSLKRLGDAGARQGGAMSWITLRLAGVGEARREVVLEGLWGATRVGEVKRLAGVLLGGVQPALLFESRLLRDEETLAEAGVGPKGAVEACVGDAAGMPGADSDECIFAFPAARWADMELAELLGGVSRDESGIEGAVQRLHAAAETRDGTVAGVLAGSMVLAATAEV